MKIVLPRWALITAGIVFAFSVVPSLTLRMTVLAMLAFPFKWLYAVPLVYRDKPWYLTYLGGIVTGLIWAVFILALAASISALKHSKKEE
jgi:hypothetical protein